jgi:MYXO-CTERM domain-containing protein
MQESPSVPELDPGSASAAALLVLGGLALVAGRRRREAI